MHGIVKDTLTTVIHNVDISTMVDKRTHQQGTNDLVEDGLEDRGLAVRVNGIDIRTLLNKQFEALQVRRTAPLLAEVVQGRVLT